MTPERAEIEEIDLERDAEASGKTPKPVKEPSPETEDQFLSALCNVRKGGYTRAEGKQSSKRAQLS